MAEKDPPGRCLEVANTGSKIKQPAKTGGLFYQRAIAKLFFCSAVMSRGFFELGDEEKTVEYSKDELTEAKRQIDSTLHKLRETIKTLEGKENAENYKSQITLAKRRVKAFEIANFLLEEKLMR